MWFEDLNEDMFLEVQNEKCNYILCLLGYIAYGVHLCNDIFMFHGKPGNGRTRHPVLGPGLHYADSCEFSVTLSNSSRMAPQAKPLCP